MNYSSEEKSRVREDIEHHKKYVQQSIDKQINNIDEVKQNIKKYEDDLKEMEKNGKNDKDDEYRYYSRRLDTENEYLDDLQKIVSKLMLEKNSFDDMMNEFSGGKKRKSIKNKNKNKNKNNKSKRKKHN